MVKFKDSIRFIDESVNLLRLDSFENPPDNCNKLKIHINDKLKLLMQIINKYKNSLLDNISTQISDNGMKLIYLYYDCEYVDNNCNFIHEKEFNISTK